VLDHLVYAVRTWELIAQSISDNDPKLHSGLGDSTTADVEILWATRRKAVAERFKSRSGADHAQSGFRAFAKGF
jgi:hypothetical protein